LPNERKRPVAYVRIDVGEVLLSRAVGVARDTAQALASLGSLYGAEPTLWQLDNSYVCYADGQFGGASTGPPVVESATVQERLGVQRDRTAEGLDELADQLGAHLPVRDPGVHAAVTLLGWLREARTSPPPLRLVLFDRYVLNPCRRLAGQWSARTGPSTQTSGRPSRLSRDVEGSRYRRGTHPITAPPEFDAARPRRRGAPARRNWRPGPDGRFHSFP
jgi:hypothetical protein